MDAQLISAANNKFGLDLFKLLFESSKGQNTFMSPFSISVALAMTQTGARGNTAKEMSQTLRWETENEEQIHKQFQGYISLLQKPQAEYQLSTANRIYMEKNYTILEEFQKKTRECYLAEPVKANFKGDPEAERKSINSWVAEQTQDKIKDLLGPNSVNSDVRMILVNAIYFKGKWKDQFDPSKTCPEPFKVAPGQTKKVPMMKKTEKYGFTINDTLKCSAIEIPYQGDNLSMVIILPNEDFGLQELVKNLTYEKLTGLLKEIGPPRNKVQLSLPKFEMTESFNLRKTLSTLGMDNAFSASADFSGITDDKEGLCISDVIHKAFVQVNEEGTEAAAATAVIMKRGCLRPSLLTVDHPFIFAIMDKQSKILLFIGTIVNPDA